MKRVLQASLVVWLLLFAHWSYGQSQTITGTVTDENGPMPWVNVIVEGTTQATTTDIDGTYSIEADTSDVLQFSFVGMRSEEIKVGNQSVIDVFMEQDNILDEVIIVAYGTAKKSDFTGSAAQIDADDIGNRAISNATSALEGAAPGISVTSASGQPGSGQSVRIRGFGSFSASSSPLYVVDGIPYYGSTNAINPNDIESISVLKDASSTALYGNKAANGVVLITTKKGKFGKGQFSLNVSSSVIDRAIPSYDRLGPDQYYEIMWESMRNSQAIPGVDSDADVSSANQFATENIHGELGNNPYNVADDQIVDTDGRLNSSARLLYPDDLNWEKAITRTGFRPSVNMSYQGATEKADYYVSLGYLNEEGYIRKSDFTRYSGRANINYKANNWLKTGLNVSGTTSKGNQAQATSSQSNSFVNPIRFTRSIGPIYNIYQHDPTTGDYILDENGQRIFYLNDNRPSGASTGRHIVAEIDWNTDLDEITSLGAKTYVDITLLEGLVFTANASIDQRLWYNTDFENKFVGDGAPGGRSSRFFNRRTGIGLNQILKYNKTLFGFHNLSLLAAHESLSLTVNGLSGSRSDIIADGNDELINFVTTTRLESETDLLRDESYFGRINYDFDRKYYLSASFRTDGSSKFARDKRWGNFWSLGGAWRLDQEAFIERDWIDLLKIRASFGEVGNNRGISYYAYQGFYNLDYNNQSEPGYYNEGSLPSPDLLWEKSASYDVALEFGLYSRLDGTIEFYNRESSNLLFDVPLPLSSGSEGISRNIGTLYNRGIEVSVNMDVIQSKTFNWNLGLNATTIDNKFTKLPQEEIINGSKKLTVGRSIYDYWLKDWVGVDPADGSALYTPTPDAIESNDSDIRTVNGATVTTNEANAEYHYAGTAIPDLLGSVSSDFRLGDFNLRFLLTYQMGGKVLDYNYRRIMSVGDYGNAIHTDILNRWQKPGDVTDIPRMDANRTTDFDATSDRWLVDASHVNLRQINFSYSLPAHLHERLNISGAQLYLSAENLLYFNARRGMDIQQNFSGTTSNVYTPSKVLTLGLNLKF